MRKKHKIIIILLIMFNICFLLYPRLEHNIYKFISLPTPNSKKGGEVIDNYFENSNEDRIAKLVNDILNDLQKNNGKLSKEYKKNVKNVEVVNKLYSHSDFDKLNYNEIKAVTEDEDAVVLKNTNKEDFNYMIEPTSITCYYFQSKHSLLNSILRERCIDDIEAGVYVRYSDKLQLKKKKINYYELADGKVIDKNTFLYFDDNSMTINLEFHDNWIITSVKKGRVIPDLRYKRQYGVDKGE